MRAIFRNNRGVRFSVGLFLRLYTVLVCTSRGVVCDVFCGVFILDRLGTVAGGGPSVLLMGRFRAFVVSIGGVGPGVVFLPI